MYVDILDAAAVGGFELLGKQASLRLLKYIGHFERWVPNLPQCCRKAPLNSKALGRRRGGGVQRQRCAFHQAPYDDKNPSSHPPMRNQKREGSLMPSLSSHELISISLLHTSQGWNPNSLLFHSREREGKISESQSEDSIQLKRCGLTVGEKEDQVCERQKACPSACSRINRRDFQLQMYMTEYAITENVTRQSERIENKTDTHKNKLLGGTPFKAGKCIQFLG